MPRTTPLYHASEHSRLFFLLWISSKLSQISISGMPFAIDLRSSSNNNNWAVLHDTNDLKWVLAICKVIYEIRNQFGCVQL